MCTVPPFTAARSMACVNACLAVSEPSVPTTMFEYMGPPERICGRSIVGHGRSSRRPVIRRRYRAGMPGSYLVAGARTPIGKLSGALSAMSAADLGAVAIAAALERAAVARRRRRPRRRRPGADGRPGTGARRGRPRSRPGIPMRVPAVNVNKVCLSGLNAIYLADQMIAAGEADIVVAAGIESMTNAPYLADGARHRIPLRQHRAARLDHRRWPVVRVRRLPDGPRHRALLGGFDQPRGPGRLCGVCRTSGLRRRSRRAGSPTRSSRSRSPARRGDPVVVEHDEGVRPETTVEPASAGCARRSIPREPSPPATPASSPTGPARSC